MDKNRVFRNVKIGHDDVKFFELENLPRTLELVSRVYSDQNFVLWLVVLTKTFYRLK
jgi:hypothetical protein